MEKKKSTLELYNELFKKPYDFSDMLYSKHWWAFHDQYGDCPEPETLEVLEVTVKDYNDFAPKIGFTDEGPVDYWSLPLTKSLADKVIDRRVLDYLDKNMQDPELRENVCSLVSPMKKIERVKFMTHDGECIMEVKDIRVDTSQIHEEDFYPDEDLPDYEDNKEKFYFTWSEKINYRP